MLSLDRVRYLALPAFSLSLSGGLHIVLGREADGTRALVDLAIGSVAPRSGTVRVAERDPRRTPSVRAAIASLRAEESLLPAATVERAVGLLLTARGMARAASDVLAAAGIEHWAGRRPETLEPLELRSVNASIALALEKPLLAVLHEPLAYLPGVERERVIASIRRWVELGVPVLCTTSSPLTAHALSGDVTLLRGGQQLRGSAGQDWFGFAPGAPVVLRVRTREPRQLVTALDAIDAVTAVDWSSTHNELCVHGHDLAQLARAITAAAVAQNVPVSAIVPSMPNWAAP